MTAFSKPLIATTAQLIGRAASGIGDLIEPSRSRTYVAFISYSHHDEKTARWLHKAIETYRIPRGVLAMCNDMPDPQSRLRPLFRDEEELAGASELGPKLDAALAQSRALIVICSPSAAQSRWVDMEIRRFRTWNPEGPVFAVIASGVPGDPQAECFPEALRWGITPSGELDHDRPLEPLAPDLQKLDKKVVKLKLTAALLGVPYDALYRRETKRRRMIAAVVSSATMVLIALLSTLTVVAVTYAGIAVRERNAAEAARRTALAERNQAIAARDLAEKRTWLAQQAASQIRSFAEAATCPGASPKHRATH